MKKIPASLCKSARYLIYGTTLAVSSDYINKA